MTVPVHEHPAAPARLLRVFAGVALLSALGIAPLNYGSTRLPGFALLIALCGAGGAAWLMACGLARSWPVLPLTPLIGAALVALSVLAWLIVLAPPEWPAFTQAHYNRLVTRWPHSMVAMNPRLTLLWAVVAVIALFALADLAREPVWRRAIGWVLLGTGAAVAALGLGQNATRAPGIYWDATRLPGAFFGPFFHHTSAGGYLNTVWPVGLALAWRHATAGQTTKRITLTLWVALGATGLVLAAHAGHVSRLPQLIAAIMLVGFAAWIGFGRTLYRIRGARLGMVVLGVGLTTLVFTSGATRLGVIQSRWSHWMNSRAVPAVTTPAPAAPAPSEWRRLMRDDLFVPSNHRGYLLGDRGAMYAVAGRAVAARPFFGWGPDGWTAAAATLSVDPFLRTFYLIVQFTHSDVLQTCVEWGLVGACGWALLVPGAVLNAGARLRRDPARDALGAGAAVALGAVLLQSCVDFPLQIPAIQLNAIALAALAWSVPGAVSLSSVPSRNSYERIQSH